MDPKQRIHELTDILTEANHRYYVLDDPQMPDFEYDRLLRELEELEQAHPELARADSPTNRVGGEALSKFEKVTHAVPLMSLQDVFSVEELEEERRMFYVALTRAKQYLHVFSVVRLHGKEMDESRFIKEMQMNETAQSNKD